MPWRYHFKRHLKPIMSFFLQCQLLQIIYTSGNDDLAFCIISVKIKTALNRLTVQFSTCILLGERPGFKKAMLQRFHYHYILCWQQSRIMILFAISTKAYSDAAEEQSIDLSNILGIQMLIPMGRENVVVVSEIVGAVVDG